MRILLVGSNINLRQTISDVLHIKNCKLEEIDNFDKLITKALELPDAIIITIDEATGDVLKLCADLKNNLITWYIPIIAVFDKHELLHCLNFENLCYVDYFEFVPIETSCFIQKLEYWIYKSQKFKKNQIVSYFEAYIHSTSDFLYLKDHHLKYIFANKAFCEFFGKAENEIIGRKDKELLPVELAEQCIISDKEVLKNKNTIRIEEILSEQIFETIKFPVTFNNGEIGIGGITRNVTEQRQVAKLIEQNEERYRFLFENHPMPMWIYDEESLKFISVNKAAIEKYGYSKKEFLSMTILDIRPEEDLENLKKILKNNIPYRTNIAMHKTKDGEIIHVEITSIQINLNDEKGRLVIAKDITDQLQAEKMLIESKRQLSLLISNLPGMVYRCLNDRNWTMKFVSDGCYALTGYYPADFIDNRKIAFNDLILPEYQEYLWNRWQKILAEKLPFEEEYQIRTANGQIKWVWERGQGVYDENGNVKYLEGYIEDITERKTTERILIESEKRYRDIFEKPQTPMLLIDSEECRIMEANDSAIRFFQQNKSAIQSKNIYELLGGDKNIIQAFINTIEAQGKATTHNIISLADNSIKTVEVYGSKVSLFSKSYIFLIVHDITQRVEAERQIRLLSKAVEQSPVSIVITDSNGTIQYVNQKVVELTGYDLSEIIGKNPRILKSGYHSKEFYAQLWNSISSGNDWEGELLNKKKNGELYWELTHISPLTNEAGNITHFIAIKKDISEQKKLINELIKAKEKAEEADRLKTAFLSNVSHEIRTPMNGILGFAELLKKPNLSGEKQKEFIEIIEQSGKRMLNIINEIIEMAKIEAGDIALTRTTVNVNKVCREVFQFHQLEAKAKGIELNFKSSMDDDECYFETDETKLYQVLLNLVKNALKFTNEGFIEFGYQKKEKDRLLFYVQDTGIGIPKEYHKAIFDRFRQVDTNYSRRYEGVGLGLAIVKSYIELMGGTIWVESEVEKGTTFYFTLPYGSEKKTEKLETLRISNGITLLNRKTIKILITEDDAASRTLLTEMFENQNVQLFHATTAEEAIELIKEINDFDLILMDLKLPGMSGYEATKTIKSWYPKLPIIAQTAFTMANERNTAFEAGCDEYITKPINARKLFSIINKFIKSDQ